MMKESEQFAEEDKKRREKVEVRNNADSLLYTAEKTKTDLGDKLSKDQIQKMDDAAAKLREAVNGGDVEKIKAENEAFSKVLQEVGTVIYQQAAAAQAAAQKPEGKTEDGKKVVDAEYEDVKDEN
jgi:molecular chaperone DnaK